MEFSSSEVAHVSPKDAEPITKDSIIKLLNEADQNFNGDNFLSYQLYKGHDEYSTRGKAQTTFPVNSEYKPLVFGDDPANYQQVYYLDYRERTTGKKANERHVGLSTNSSRRAEENVLREIEYILEDDVPFVEVGEYVNGAQNYDFESPLGLYVKPEGFLRAKYKLLDSGEHVLMDSTVKRVDDTVFVDGHARWFRTLQVRGHDGGEHLKRGIKYQDSFTLTDDNKGGRVFITTEGPVESPDSIHFGFGTLEKKNPIEVMKSKDGRVMVTVSKGEESMVEFFRQFPEYKFLDKNGWFRKPTFEDAQDCLQARIRQIQEHWAQSSNIFNLFPVLGEGNELNIVRS